MIWPRRSDSGSTSTTARKSGVSTPVPSWRHATYTNFSGGAFVASSGEAYSVPVLSSRSVVGIAPPSLVAPKLPPGRARQRAAGRLAHERALGRRAHVAGVLAEHAGAIRGGGRLVG